MWISDATPLAALNEVMRVFPGKVKPIVVAPDKLTEAISKTYSESEGSAQQIVGDIEGEFDITRMMAEVPDIEDLLETEDDAPIIRMINALLTQAARDGASDIHIEAFETLLDGALPHRRHLRDIVRPNARAARGARARASRSWRNLDIAEKRLPQDGRITLRVGGKAVDVRVSTLPTGARRARGAAPARQGPVALDARERSAWPTATLEALRHADPPAARHHPGHRADRLGQDHHAVRARSAGSTTRRTNIMTVEDPIEYDLEGIGQTQVNAKIEHGLRARAARDPAPGPGRDHDRRDPRPRDRADRRAGLADRPPGARDPAHQRCRRARSRA